MVLSNRAIPRKLKEHALTVERPIKRENGVVRLAVGQQVLVYEDFPLAEIAFGEGVDSEDLEREGGTYWFVF